MVEKKYCPTNFLSSFTRSHNELQNNKNITNKKKPNNDNDWLKGWNTLSTTKRRNKQKTVDRFIGLCLISVWPLNSQTEIDRNFYYFKLFYIYFF